PSIGCPTSRTIPGATCADASLTWSCEEHAAGQPHLPDHGSAVADRCPLYLHKRRKNRYFPTATWCARSGLSCGKKKDDAPFRLRASLCSVCLEPPAGSAESQ